ncbi:Nitroreductase [Enhydrobacter aerosaccus]|uniref:Nitroreductase n=1 Tax=Enhydrobacter aerosaccus TaxID=225324 RepID=A0A1T4R8G4_9HYPH|nr:NADPH-dependent oxidoreductase [Enhydrobacter aerosaccus]SKA12106.1 Nitroreductase [Enhydrobacter aerosaccus]
MDSLTPQPFDKGASLAHRYGAAVPAAGPWNETIARQLEHRSVRAYKADPLPAGTVETLVAAAQSAATSSNMQWWSAIAITDPAKKKVLAEVAGGQKHIEQCPLFIAWVADMARNQRISAQEKVEFECMPWLETFMVACIDAALAAQNAVVAAESLGLGTVYIGAMRNDPVRVAKLLGLPPQSFVVVGLCVGYAAETGAGEVKPRLPQATVLHREQYNVENEIAERHAYDAEMANFSQRHELQAATWTQRVLNRLGPIKSMNGREKLRTVLAGLGFEIR